MSRNRAFAAAAAASLLIVLPSAPTARAADGYGSISGQFVLDGEVPEPRIEHKKGADVKDSQVCAAETLYKNDLVVDPQTKGIANIFVYILRIDAGRIHPDLKETPKDKREVVFDQRGCRFTPHAMFVRTDQTILVKSDDPIAHNTHTYPLVNMAQNFLLPPKARKGVPLKHPASEILPIKVGCDIHPWMRAYWLILDHPYAAVTDEKGKFTIKKLPAGQYEFRVWHERVGYVGAGTRRGFEVTLEDGDEETVGPFKVPLSKFALE